MSSPSPPHEEIKWGGEHNGSDHGTAAEGTGHWRPSGSVGGRRPPRGRAAEAEVSPHRKLHGAEAHGQRACPTTFVSPTETAAQVAPEATGPSRSPLPGCPPELLQRAGPRALREVHTGPRHEMASLTPTCSRPQPAPLSHPGPLPAARSHSTGTPGGVSSCGAGPEPRPGL